MAALLTIEAQNTEKLAMYLAEARDLGVELVVTRQVLGWVQPKRPRMFDLGSLPVWAIDHLDGTIHYGFPMLPDNPGLKVAHHWRGPRADPETVARDAQPGDEADFRTVLPISSPNRVDTHSPNYSRRLAKPGLSRAPGLPTRLRREPLPLAAGAQTRHRR